MHRLALVLVPAVALAGTAIAATTSVPPHRPTMDVTPAYPVPRGPGARRITDALNLLEAKGYGDFRDFRDTGSTFAATVTQAGKQFAVTIDPDNDAVTRRG